AAPSLSSTANSPPTAKARDDSRSRGAILDFPGARASSSNPAAGQSPRANQAAVGAPPSSATSGNLATQVGPDAENQQAPPGVAEAAAEPDQPDDVSARIPSEGGSVDDPPAASQGVDTRHVGRWAALSDSVLVVLSL